MTLPLQAAQALEPSALVGLQHLPDDGMLVLVGDQKQLPTTVISTVAESANYGQSLFERLEKVGNPCSLFATPQGQTLGVGVVNLALCHSCRCA